MGGARARARVRARARPRARTRVLVVSGTIVSPPLVRKHLAPGRQEPTPE